MMIARGFRVALAVALCALWAGAARAGSYEDTVLADNPHWYLRLNEPNGSTVAEDASPNNRDGNYHQFAGDNPTITGVAGVPGGGAGNTAAELTGPGRISQVYVADGAHPTDYTIEAWIKADPGATTGRNILVRTSGNPTATFSHQLRLEPSGAPRHYSYSSTGGKWLDGNYAVAADQWYHVVGTATGGNPGHYTIYVNGERQKEWYGNAGTYWTGGNQWRIGSIAGGGTWFDGVIDEVAVYHTELSAERIWLHHRQGAIAAPRDDTPASGPGIRTLDLADVVGGGNGCGTGTFNAGINPGTGFQILDTTANPGVPITGPGYHTVDLPFVDGVFIPGTGTMQGYMQIASTGLTMQQNYPARDGRSWGYFRHGPTGGVSPVLNGVNYTASGNSLIGMHANKGITFDLDAIRAANGGLEIGSFSTVFGDASGNGGSTDVNVYLDGVLMYGAGGNQALPQNIRDIHVPISASDRFLTLVATDGGDTYSYDQTMYGNPRLELGRNIAAGKPVFASAYYTGANGFPAVNLTDGDLNDIYPGDALGRSFWLGPDGDTPTLIVDLEGEFLINRIDLQNTRNGGSRDRGTSDFTLLVSLDGAEWTEILQDTLADQRNTSWAMPLETFTFDNTWARYVKLQIDGYHGNKGAGLNEIRVYEAVPEPATMALLALAAAGLGGYVRRRRTRA